VKRTRVIELVIGGSNCVYSYPVTDRYAYSSASNPCQQKIAIGLLAILVS